MTALFSKATDCVTMTLRRGVEPTKRDFEWFRYPFLSVKKCVEEVTILSPNATVDSNHRDKNGVKETNSKFRTFKDLVKNPKQFDETKQKRFQSIEIVNNTNSHKLSRTFSSPCAASRRGYLQRERQQRRYTVDDINNKQNMLLNGYFHRYDLAYNSHKISYHGDDKKEGKYIADEIEKLSMNNSNQELQQLSELRGGESDSSLNSAFSSSTLSSMSSSISAIEQVN